MKNMKKGFLFVTLFSLIMQLYGFFYASQAKESREIVVKSDIFFSERGKYEPEKIYRDEDGEQYELKRWETESAVVESRTVETNQEVCFEEVECQDLIPTQYLINTGDERTGQYTAEQYPILSMKSQNSRWMPDFEFKLVFHTYDAGYYRLGDKEIPYNAKKPELIGCEKELLDTIGVNESEYHILDVNWVGEPYRDREGIVCRDAVASGERKVQDYVVRYGGVAVLPERKGWRGVAVYGLPETFMEPAKDKVILSEPIHMPEMVRDEPEWILSRKEQVITLSLLGILLLLILWQVARRWKMKNYKKKSSVGVFLIVILMWIWPVLEANAEYGPSAPGWKLTEGRWYFYDSTAGKERRIMLTGWHWIDGCCYYLEADSGAVHPYGAMYASEITPDGFTVDITGAWVVDGVMQFIQGKGIQTKQDQNRNEGRNTGTESSTESAEPGKTEESAEAEESLPSASPSDYNPEPEKASPSEAQRIQWSVFFVERGNHNNQLFKQQQGFAEEGTQVMVDFPENIIGRDFYHYNSLKGSPYIIPVSGTGMQKYYIEFEKGDRVSEKKDPDKQARDRLSHWMKIAEKADAEIMNREPGGNLIITDCLTESNERLKNLVSMVNDADRHEIYLIARNHEPSSFVIGQMFQSVINLSELVLDRFVIEEKPYIVLRVGFSRTFEAAFCSHDFMLIDEVPYSCLSNGHETVFCQKCGYEATVILPSPGHLDKNKDGVCDICYRSMTGEEMPEIVHFNIGDIQVRNLNGKKYLFRCIDDDYTDNMDNSQSSALFLCDTVIGSDVDSNTGLFQKMHFGSNNNYKTSHVRSWLNRSRTEELFDNQMSYVGVNTAYGGSTAKKTYEQFQDSDLIEYEKPFQFMEDRVFILSVEEAVKYREYLWKFNGSSENNPETQYSAYSKGYYLRTPHHSGGGGFRYGNRIYAVDMVNGNIHMVDVFGTDVGIRPVMTIIQG